MSTAACSIRRSVAAPVVNFVCRRPANATVDRTRSDDAGELIKRKPVARLH
jgi:hypothetical protein|tara:strand:+ start:372 stop:524 length:153 start_codon:yes stop_codon:yes gene_type:complete